MVRPLFLSKREWIQQVIENMDKKAPICDTNIAFNVAEYTSKKDHLFVGVLRSIKQNLQRDNQSKKGQILSTKSNQVASNRLSSKTSQTVRLNSEVIRLHKPVQVDGQVTEHDAYVSDPTVLIIDTKMAVTSRESQMITERVTRSKRQDLYDVVFQADLTTFKKIEI